MSTSRQPRPWRPSPLIWASAAVHAFAAFALISAPSEWPEPVLMLVLNHLLLCFAGLWPRSSLLGPNVHCLPYRAVAREEVAITIDDGPDPQVTPQVLDILDRHGAHASFFCIGSRAEAQPELVAEIVRRGHSVENHSNRHGHGFSLYGPWRMAREVRTAQQTLTRLAGTPPAFFRAPAGLRNPFLEPVLARLGLYLASWTRRGFDTREADPERVLQRLTKELSAGDVLLLHDGHAATSSESGQPVIVDVLPRLLEALAERGLRAVSLREGYAG